MNPALAERHEVEMNPLSLNHSADERPAPKAPVPASPAQRRHWPIVVILIAAAAGGGGWYAYTHFIAAATDGQAQKTDEIAPPSIGDLPLEKTGGGGGRSVPSGPIATVPVQSALCNDVLRVTGSLAADELSSVASNTSGIVAKVMVDRGTPVRKGDVLVQLDPTDAQNRLAEGRAMLQELMARLGLEEGNIQNFNPHDQPEVRLAKASADLAKTNLDRAKELIDKKVISDEAYDSAATEYELAHQRYRQALFLIKQAYATCRTAMAKLAILEKAVADTTIRAPFDGWVAQRHVSVGEQISSGMQATEVVTLVRVDPLRLRLSIPQQNIASIRPGQKVTFSIDSYPNRTFEGAVRYISPVLNDTRSMVVGAVVANPDFILRPGLFATAKLELPEKHMRMLVPLSAVKKVGDVGNVFIVADGVARKRVVGLGEQFGDLVEIRSGLNGNERLAADPNAVHDGDKAGS